MFWQSIGGGLGVLLHLDTWFGMLIYGFLVLVPTILVGVAAERDMRFGCVGMLLLPVFQVFASIVVLWILLPIILGIGEHAIWGFPLAVLRENPFWLLRTTLTLTVLAVITSVIPVLGRMGTFTNFVVGSVAIATATRMFAESSGRPALASLQYMPGVWTLLGFLIIGGLASAVGGIAITAAALATSRSTEGAEQPKPGPLAMSAVGIVGLIPAFIYGAWLGLQSKALLP